MSQWFLVGLLVKGNEVGNDLCCHLDGIILFLLVDPRVHDVFLHSEKKLIATFDLLNTT